MAMDDGNVRYRVEIARPEQIGEAQRLRYRIFAEELGARLAHADEQLDRDEFDEHCRHLLVRDLTTGRLVAGTRVLDQAGACAAGRFYSQGEFEMADVLSLPGRFVEVGRTCVDPGYRNGAVIATLWQGIAGLIRHWHIDYLFGCASVPFNGAGDTFGHAVIRQLMERHLDTDIRARPLEPLAPRAALPAGLSPRMPPLLRTYVNLGARACGAPCWDPTFGVADVLMLLDLRQLNPRFARHFLPGFAAAPREPAFA